MTRKYVPEVFSQKKYWILCPLNLMTIFVAMPKSCPNHCLARFQESNWCYLSWHGLSWCRCDSNQFDSEFQNFPPNVFNIKIILAHSVFGNYVAFRVFDFTYLCNMPRRAPVVKIRHSPDAFEQVEAPHRGNLWYYSSDAYWRVHTDDAITITPEFSTSHFRTTLETAKGDVLVTVSPSVNFSSRLVGIIEGWENCLIVQTLSRTPKGLYYRKIIRYFS